MKIKIIAALLTLCAVNSNAQSFSSDLPSFGSQSTSHASEKAPTIF